jgi:hypothetical protein
VSWRLTASSHKRVKYFSKYAYIYRIVGRAIVAAAFDLNIALLCHDRGTCR